jgi:hypothetical protein
MFPEHLTTTSYDFMQPRATPTTNIDPQIINSDIPLALPQLLVTPASGSIPPSFPTVPASEHHIPLLATPSIVIHAQTVIINNHPSPSSSISENGSIIFDAKSPAPLKQHSTQNLEDKPQAPFHLTTPAMPPRDLSVLRSCHRTHCPFSSLQQRSRRRQSWQSTPARGLSNWDSNLHLRDLSQVLQGLGWSPPVH